MRRNYAEPTPCLVVEPAPGAACPQAAPGRSRRQLSACNPARHQVACLAGGQAFAPRSHLPAPCGRFPATSGEAAWALFPVSAGGDLCSRAHCSRLRRRLPFREKAEQKRRGGCRRGCPGVRAKPPVGFKARNLPVGAAARGPGVVEVSSQPNPAPGASDGVSRLRGVLQRAVLGRRCRSERRGVQFTRRAYHPAFSSPGGVAAPGRLQPARLHPVLLDRRCCSTCQPRLLLLFMDSPRA